MAINEVPQSRSLVVVTDYMSDTGKTAQRRSNYNGVRLDAAPEQLFATGRAIFSLKYVEAFELLSVTENKLISA